MFETANGLYIDAGLTLQERYERMKKVAQGIAGMSVRKTHESGEKYRVLGSSQRLSVPPEMVRVQYLSVSPDLSLFWRRTEELDYAELNVTYPEGCGPTIN